MSSARDPDANPRLRGRAPEPERAPDPDPAALHGVEQAYAPVLSDLLLADWFASGLDDDFLTQHYSELLSGEVADAFAARIADGEPSATLAHAVLVLARHGEDRVAYRVHDDPAFGATLLESAWRSVDFERLAAVATLCRDAVPIEDARGRLATVLALSVFAPLSFRLYADHDNLHVSGGIGDSPEMADPWRRP
jgi:hypothetical protein